MSKNVLGVIAGLAVWAIVVSVVGAVMRAAWPAYAAVADAMTFTLPMQIARLAISAVATLAAGWATASIVSRSLVARVMPGVLLLVAFIPVHINLFDKFPLWYHLTFLVSLIPLTYAGGLICTWRPGVRVDNGLRPA
ncbi:MAG TPA: hypothetical protein VH417_12310 [Vicinamibacterales bacterium]|jgi:hypothetical protein